MNERTALLAVLVVAAMTVVAVPAAGLGPGDIAGGQSPEDDVSDEANETNARAAANGTDNETPPGSKLTGVVGVQKAEIEGEVQSRSFDIALNRSDDNDSKAAVIAGQVTDLESRLDALQERKNELDQARENGTITRGEYRARIAEVGARIATAQRLANQTENAAQGVPAETLEEKGVNATEIRNLRNNARNLSGQEVASIAREIAGPGAGKGLGQGPPANKTNPGQGNGANPGQGNNAPGNRNGPGNDTGPGDGRPGMGEPGPPESDTGNNETGTPDMGEPGNDTGAPEDGDTDGTPADNETKPNNGTESGVDNGDTPDNGGSDGADDETSMSVSDTAYAGTLDGIVTLNPESHE